MFFDKTLPQFDIPVDFLTGEDDFEQILTYYSHFPCKIKSAVFVLVKQGNIRVTINHSEYNLKAGDFVILIPDAFIQVHELDSKIRLVFAGFSSVFMDSINLLISGLDYIPVIRENSVISLDDELYKYYDDFFKLLIQRQEISEFSKSQELIKYTLMSILEQIYELYKVRYNWGHNKQNREKEIFLEFLRHLNENYKTEHSVSFYASKVGVTLQHFCKTIKQASDKTPTEIINRTLIMDAKSHLKSTTLSVKQIAFSLGFENIGFFYKFFKKHTGMTPQEYREK